VKKGLVEPTYLDCIELFLRPIPLVRKSDDGGGAFANGQLLTDAILLAETGGRVSCGALRATAVWSATTSIPIMYGVTVRVRPAAGACGALRGLARQLGGGCKKVFQVKLVLVLVFAVVGMHTGSLRLVCDCARNLHWSVWRRRRRGRLLHGFGSRSFLDDGSPW
jgi:hypothetical protein